jgi:hemoglobin
MEKHDIRDKKDIELMIRTFYGSLFTDESIKEVFANTDFEAHMPHMIAFWSFVLLDEEGYKTNVFEKHMHLSIKEEHFDTWVRHFIDTIDLLFKGEKAELAKLRAQTLAFTFRSKMKQMRKI